MFRYLFISLSFILNLFLLTACESRQPQITHKLKENCDYYSFQTAQCLNSTELFEALQPYSVIFIGDHHSEQKLHTKVAELISLLSKHGTRVRLANEWFYPKDEEILLAYANSDLNETEFMKRIGWKKRFRHHPFNSFRPMYKAIIENGGTLHGINLSKQERKNISDQNLSAMNKEELLFNKGLDLEVEPHQELVMPYLQHCHAPKKEESQEACEERMYRVQVAWDSKMGLEAHKLSQTLKENEKLLVFAGSMHVEQGLGIPLRFSRLSNLPSVTIIPMQNNRKEVMHALGDFLLFYPSEKKP